MFLLDVNLCSNDDMNVILGIIHYVYIGIMIVVPIILIFVGMFDLAKAVTEKKDEDIKKAQQSLIKKAIAAVLVFLVPFLVGLIMRMAGTDDYKQCWCKITKINNKSCNADIGD